VKILIAGAGKVGTTLARKLSEEGYDLTVIDSNQQLVESVVDRYDLMAVEGNCASMNTLNDAGIQSADLVIAVTNEDEVNLLCCMTAHSMNPRVHTIARIRNPEYSQQIYQMRDVFGLSLAVNPDRQAALEIERLLKYPGFLKREAFAKGRVELVELRLDEKSKLCNVALSDLFTIIRNKVLVCAVLRDGKVVIPGGNYVLQAKDRIYVTGTTHNLALMLKDLGIITHKVRKVMLCGGSRSAFYLAQRLLKSGVAVDIVERDEFRCRQLAERLPRANVICGDASSQYILESEGIQTCDAIVAMTGMDELNVVVALYARSRGVEQIITKLSHEENNNILDSLSLGSLICPKELSSTTIVRYVRAIQNQTGAALTVHSIADGRVEACEFRVEPGTLHIGQPLKELNLKKNVLLACIMHGAQTEIPNGDSVYQEGDTLIVVTNGGVISQLNDIFV
jgi:trk system potassium uptake protein TrkA